MVIKDGAYEAQDSYDDINSILSLIVCELYI